MPFAQPVAAVQLSRSLWLRTALALGVLIALLALASQADAAPAAADEFTASAAKFENWVKGNLGKTAAFIALCVGSIVAAIRKDWSWFAGGVVLAMGIGIIVGLINSSFTALI
jgi:conjugal transfer pilus assembly protein TraA